MIFKYVSRKHSSLKAWVGKLLMQMVIVMSLVGMTMAGNVWAANSCDVVKSGLVACYPFDGNANDASANGNHGTVNGATLTADRFGKPNSAYQFNGMNNDITVPNAPSQQISTNQISISAWVTLEKDVLNTQQRIVNKQYSAGTSWGLEVFGNGYSGSSGNTVVFHNSNGSTWSNCLASTVSLVPKVTYHVVAIAESNTAKIYLDGNLVQTCGNMLGIPQTINTDIVIGARGGVYFINGTIDDVSIYNRALTKTEIQTLYQLKDSPSTECEHATYSVTNNVGKLVIPFVEVPLLNLYTHEPTGELAVFSSELRQISHSIDFNLLSNKLNLIFLTTNPDLCHAVYDETQKTLHVPFVDIDNEVYDVKFQHLKDTPLEIGTFHLESYDLVQ